MRYDVTTSVDEPIEVRIAFASGSLYVLSACKMPTGLLAYSLSCGSQPHSLSTLQVKKPWPAKAVSGWQAEVKHVIATGIGEVVEIR